MKNLRRKPPIHLHSKQDIELPSPHELKQLLMTVRAQRDEWQQRAKENEEAASQRDEAEQRANEAASQLVHVQQEIQTYQIESNELKLQGKSISIRLDTRTQKNLMCYQ